MIYDKSLRLPLWSFSQEDCDELQKASSLSNEPPLGKVQATKKSEKDEQTSTPQSASTSHTDFGTIINLISEDTYNVMSFVWICHYVWAIPVKVGSLCV